MQCSELHFKKIYYRHKVYPYFTCLFVCLISLNIPTSLLQTRPAVDQPFVGNKESIHLRKDPPDGSLRTLPSDLMVTRSINGCMVVSCFWQKDEKGQCGAPISAECLPGEKSDRKVLRFWCVAKIAAVAHWFFWVHCPCFTSVRMCVCVFVCAGRTFTNSSPFLSFPRVFMDVRVFVLASGKKGD